MRSYLLILGTFLISIISFGQNIEEFKQDVIKVTKGEPNKYYIKGLLGKYPKFLRLDRSVYFGDYKDKKPIKYSLSEFKETDVYKNNIQDLLDSKNPNKRHFAYMLITFSGDKSYEEELLKRLKTEESKENLMNIGMALMYLETDRTTPVFDFLVENEEFGGAQLLPLFVRLNKDSLQNTAYNRINSKNDKAKVLSVQLFSFTGKNKKTEQLLLEAVKNWDYDIKGYAVYSMKQLGMGNLKDVLIPLLDNPKTREIALQALSNSPTKEDVDYLKELMKNKEGAVSKDLLNGLFYSKNPENVKQWLKLVATEKVPENYFFMPYKQPVLFTDNFLKEVQNTLKTTQNPIIQRRLILVLRGRSDEESKKIVSSYLDSRDSGVRYWTISIMKGEQSKEVLDKLVKMLKNRADRVSSITDVLIENEVDTLQSVYKNIYDTSEGFEWRRNSMVYLANFPKKEYKDLFTKALQEKDFAIRRGAARGLSNLKDESSVDEIIKACELERAKSEYNVQTYLVALSYIKGDKAKKYIESYENSEEVRVRELVEELLKDWDKERPKKKYHSKDLEVELSGSI